MEPIDAELASIACLPVEIVVKVLECLPATDQTQCKRVCRMWCHVLTERDEYWRRRCAREFSDTYGRAHSKCHPPLTWGQLYQSLNLWDKLDVAKETWTKILDTGYALSINVVYLYKDNLVLQVYDPKSYMVVYYFDKYTRETKKRVVLYKESVYDNDEYLHLRVDSSILKIHKLDYRNGKPFRYDTQPVTVDKVHDYVVIGRDVYYTKCIDVNKIFVRKRSDNYSSSTVYIAAPLPIKSISYYCNYLHVLLENNWIFKVVENELVYVPEQYESNVFMPLLYGFQLIDHSKLDCYWYLEPSRYRHPHGKNIYYHYHNLIFAVDKRKEVLSIFRKAVVSDEPWFNGYSSEPSDTEAADLVKVYDLSNFMLRGLTDLLDFTSIDVVEKENGHTVYVATESKILVLDLDH